jgi:hypothetical protein
MSVFSHFGGLTYYKAVCLFAWSFSALKIAQELQPAFTNRLFLIPPTRDNTFRFMSPPYPNLNWVPQHDNSPKMKLELMPEIDVSRQDGTY